MMPHPAVTSSVWKRGREGGKERDKGERGEKKLIFSKMNAAKSKCSRINLSAKSSLFSLVYSHRTTHSMMYD